MAGALTTFASRVVRVAQLVSSFANRIEQYRIWQHPSKKRGMLEEGVGGMEAFMNLAMMGFVFAAANIAVGVLSASLRGGAKGAAASSKELLPPTLGSHPPLSLSALAATSYHLEYLLSFVLISMISPLTYAVADAVRRLTVISVGKTIFKKSEDSFTATNILGMAMALLGACGYSLLR